MSRILCLFDLYLDWFSFRLVKAEEKKVPLRPESDEVIARIMALPVDKRTYVKIFKIGMLLVLLICLLFLEYFVIALSLLFPVLGESEVPKLKLNVVDVGKKKRGSTESGSSSDVVSETIASRMKRTRRAAAATPKVPVDLDPIEEEVDTSQGTRAITTVPEPVVMDLDTVLEGGKEGRGEASQVLSNTDGQDLLVSLTTSSLKVCGVSFSHKT